MEYGIGGGAVILSEPEQTIRWGKLRHPYTFAKVSGILSFARRTISL